MKIKREYHSLLNRVQEKTKTDRCDVSHWATEKCPIKLPLTAMNESRYLNNHIYIDKCYEKTNKPVLTEPNNKHLLCIQSLTYPLYHRPIKNPLLN